MALISQGTSGVTRGANTTFQASESLTVGPLSELKVFDSESSPILYPQVPAQEVLVRKTYTRLFNQSMQPPNAIQVIHQGGGMYVYVDPTSATLELEGSFNLKIESFPNNVMDHNFADAYPNNPQNTFYSLTGTVVTLPNPPGGTVDETRTIANIGYCSSYPPGMAVIVNRDVGWLFPNSYNSWNSSGVSPFGNKLNYSRNIVDFQWGRANMWPGFSLAMSLRRMVKYRRYGLFHALHRIEIINNELNNGVVTEVPVGALANLWERMTTKTREHFSYSAGFARNSAITVADVLGNFPSYWTNEIIPGNARSRHPFQLKPPLLEDTTNEASFAPPYGGDDGEYPNPWILTEVSQATGQGMIGSELPNGEANFGSSAAFRWFPEVYMRNLYFDGNHPTYRQQQTDYQDEEIGDKDTSITRISIAGANFQHWLYTGVFEPLRNHTVNSVFLYDAYTFTINYRVVEDFPVSIFEKFGNPTNKGMRLNHFSFRLNFYPSYIIKMFQFDAPFFGFPGACPCTLPNLYNFNAANESTHYSASAMQNGTIPVATPYGVANVQGGLLGPGDPEFVVAEGPFVDYSNSNSSFPRLYRVGLPYVISPTYIQATITNQNVTRVTYGWTEYTRMVNPAQKTTSSIESHQYPHKSAILHTSQTNFQFSTPVPSYANPLVILPADPRTGDVTGDFYTSIPETGAATAASIGTALQSWISTPIAAHPYNQEYLLNNIVTIEHEFILSAMPIMMAFYVTADHFDNTSTRAVVGSWHLTRPMKIRRFNLSLNDVKIALFSSNTEKELATINAKAGLINPMFKIPYLDVLYANQNTANMQENAVISNATNLVLPLSGLHHTARYGTQYNTLLPGAPSWPAYFNNAYNQSFMGTEHAMFGLHTYNIAQAKIVSDANQQALGNQGSPENRFLEVGGGLMVVRPGTDFGLPSKSATCLTQRQMFRVSLSVSPGEFFTPGPSFKTSGYSDFVLENPLSMKILSINAEIMSIEVDGVYRVTTHLLSEEKYLQELSKLSNPQLQLVSMKKQNSAMVFGGGLEHLLHDVLRDGQVRRAAFSGERLLQEDINRNPQGGGIESMDEGTMKDFFNKKRKVRFDD